MILNYPLGLHWDGKIMADNENNITKIERLPVLVLDSEGIEKLLGVEKLQVELSQKLLVYILQKQQ